jgi:glutamine cyclotransferase
LIASGRNKRYHGRYLGHAIGLAVALLVYIGCLVGRWVHSAPNSPQETNETQALSIGAPQRHPVYSYQVVNSWPHDPQAFTQGLVYHDGVLYESTGLLGRSSLRKVALETGQVLTKIDVAPQYFAEGLAIFNDRAIQLTWQNHIGFVYQLANFQLLQNFSYSSEGWGLTDDGHNADHERRH